jgi:hypothetical protein
VHDRQRGDDVGVPGGRSDVVARGEPRHEARDMGIAGTRRVDHDHLYCWFMARCRTPLEDPATAMAVSNDHRASWRQQAHEGAGGGLYIVDIREDAHFGAAEAQ